MIKIGTIAKAQGIKGEVKIVLQNNPDKYSELKKVYIDGSEKKIESFFVRPNGVFVKIEGVSDRNSAELLRGKELFVNEQDLEQLKENEFYFRDLIGAEVYDENNKKIGELVDIEQYGAADVISINERNIIFSVPFINSIFVNIQQKKVFVNREEYDKIKISD